MVRCLRGGGPRTSLPDDQGLVPMPFGYQLLGGSSWEGPEFCGCRCTVKCDTGLVADFERIGRQAVGGIGYILGAPAYRTAVF